MGKKNPFAFRYKANYLMLLSDLNGEIVHVMGNPSMLNTTHKKLFRKNFFNDLITLQTRFQLFDEFHSAQILPPWLNFRTFVCSCQIKNKKLKPKTIIGKFKTQFTRIYAVFSSQFNDNRNAKIRTYKNFKQIEELIKEDFTKQIIMIYMQPFNSNVKIEAIVQEDFEEGDQKSISNSQKTPPVKIDNVFEEIGPIFETPQKEKIQYEYSTNKPPVIGQYNE